MTTADARPRPAPALQPARLTRSRCSSAGCRIAARASLAVALAAVLLALGQGTALAQDRGWRDEPPPYARDDDGPPARDVDPGGDGGGEDGRRYDDRRYDDRRYDDRRYDDRRYDDRRYDDRSEDRAYDRRYRDRGDDDRRYDDGAESDRDGAPAGAVDAPNTEVFREDLDRWGRWEDDPEFGAVWVPEDVGDDWRPYTRGQWTYTADYGWYWVGSEPWGWATYHYGRWAYDARRHWFWVPDTVWAPAWVAWRYSDDYVGWAPLPPGHGLHDAGARDPLVAPRFAHYWIFVRPRFFGMPGLARFVQPPYVTDHIFPRTRPAGGIVSDGTRVVDRGLPVGEVQRLTGQPPRTFRPVFSRRQDGRRAPRAGLGTVTIFAPRWGVPPREHHGAPAGRPAPAGHAVGNAPVAAPTPHAPAPPAQGPHPAPSRVAPSPPGATATHTGGPAPSAAPAPAHDRPHQGGEHAPVVPAPPPAGRPAPPAPAPVPAAAPKAAPPSPPAHPVAAPASPPSSAPQAIAPGSPQAPRILNRSPAPPPASGKPRHEPGRETAGDHGDHKGSPEPPGQGAQPR